MFATNVFKHYDVHLFYRLSFEAQSFGGSNGWFQNPDLSDFVGIKSDTKLF